ncbi:protein Spindly isoform X1 [Sarcophilus harrisii]|uniref:protein Spindly isoform X1 n=1 Tax=Sarcophilus harrisii TaxID=9305 RepID=UPI000C7A8A7E|nr:protein Spindly isoform X1 [Sarcophilus harrisii]XP_023361991.1 protein Spindly isoform X1 [Sarcophilus harrisii]XP_023361994.1 protein Spindly isoform X1 [Sarcophilus harrisii]
MESELVLNLRRQLKEAEEERMKAAQYGLLLLESQNELQNQLDKMRSEIMSTTENYEQEKFTLQREVELKNRMLESLNSECDAIRQQQKLQLEKLEEQLSRSHGQEVNELKNKLEKLKAELDEARLSEKQLKHKVEHQKEILSAKSEELRIMSERVHETMSSEMLSLQIEITELESVKASLEERMNELQYRQEQLELTNNNLQHQLECLQGEKEDREKEVVSYFNALEKARVTNQDLQTQLDHALQQSMDPNSKGNSLFAEVEDRRAEMERQFISMKVKYQSLQKQHLFNREQMQRMKLQIATLLQMKGSQTEFEQLERLQAMLEQKNGEVENLLVKIKQLEKFKNLYENMESKPSSILCTPEDNSYYIDLLQMKLENSNKEIEKIRDELSLQRMKALYESQRVLEVERKLFTNERHLQLFQSENMNLRVKLDELKMKYEPEEPVEIPIHKRKREKLPLDVPLCKDEVTTSTALENSSNITSNNESSASNIGGESQIPSENSGNSAMTLPLSQTPPVDQQPLKEKKCVKIIGIPSSSEVLHEKSDNTNNSSRSVASLVSPQGSGQAPSSVLFRCMTCALRFFICFLSVACNVILQLHLLPFNFSKTLKKTKMISDRKDS